MIGGLIRSLSVLVMAALLGQLPLALAQSTYGTITGTVSDANGAVISKARVEITNQSTGVVRPAVTDDQGSYSVVNLDAGIYSITITAPGMDTATRKDLPLLAREIVRADFQLQVSGASQQVEVRANAAIVDQSLTISDSK